jgi:hypothetical protein
MIAALVLLVLAAYLLACVVTGFGSPGNLSGFTAENTPLRHRYRQPVQQVKTSYRRAVSITPGMRLVEEDSDEMLVDTRPSTRVLGGNFGLVIRLRFRADGRTTRIEADSRNKVPFAWGVNHDAAFVHAERALRSRAKQAGLCEMLEGIE